MIQSIFQWVSKEYWNQIALKSGNLFMHMFDYSFKSTFWGNIITNVIVSTDWSQFAGKKRKKSN